MSLSSTTSRTSSAGNGVTTVFNFPYYFLSSADLVVILRNNTTGVETTKTLTTHYTVSGAGVSSGGSVTMLVAPASGETLVIYRNPAITQTIDLKENDSIPAETLEQGFDRLTMIAQRLSSRLDRTVTLSDGYSGSFTPTMPTPTADAVLAFDPTGVGLIAGPTVTALLAGQTAAAASAVAASASAGAASASATAAGTSATNAATSATNAGLSASAAALSAAMATGLASYATDAAFVSANGVATAGDTYFNSTSSKIRYYTGSAWTDVGAGAGGGVNYFSANSDAETDTNGWTGYDNSTATPTTLTSGTFTGFTRTTTSPLRGTASFLFTPSAIGKGASYLITVDPADRGQVLSISCDFEVSGTLTEGDYAIWVYDVTNSTLIQPTPYKIPGAVSGQRYRWQGTFQTSTTGVTYRIGQHQVVSTAVTLKTDNWYCGPQAKSYGSANTDWVSWTPTGSWSTNTTYTGKMRQIGDSYEFEGLVSVSGAPTAANLSVNLPVTIDTTKISSVNDNYSSLGTFMANDSGTGQYFGNVAYFTSTSVKFKYAKVTSAANNDEVGEVSNASPQAAWAAGDTLHFKFAVPVAGKSSGMLVSSDADTRVVDCRVTRATAITGFAPNNSRVKVALNSVSKDSHSLFDTTNNRYVVGVQGDYTIATYIEFDSTNVLNNRYILQIAHTNAGGTTYYNADYIVPAASSFFSLKGCFLATDAKAGDYFEIYVFGVGNNSASTLTIATSTYATFLKASGPSQIAASESVNCRVNTSTTTMSASFATLVHTTKNFDSHGAYSTSTGRFTCPTAGKYLVTGSLSASATWTAGAAIQMQIKKNGATSYGYVIQRIDASVSSSRMAQITDTIDCVAGDYIEVQGAVDGTSPTLVANSGNYATFTRVGN